MHYHKLRFLTLLISIVVCSCNSEPQDSLSRHSSPNVLLILADDLGFNDVGIYNNNPKVHTPNIDQLATEGIRFTRHYTYSTCSPSRAALLTGMNPARVGFTPNGRGISPDLTTLPEFLKSQGYRTHHIGKWHTGDTIRAAWPDAQGFDSWFGFLNQWRLQGVSVNGMIQPAPPTYINPWLRTGSHTEQRHQGHLTDILGQHTVNKIRAFKGSQPWFINLWFYAPHTPVIPAPRYQQRYPNTEQGRYYALLDQLDDTIGVILTSLELTGQQDNTVVIVASDNGGTNRTTDNNAPFIGQKASFQEGGVRTPLIIRWPKTIQESLISNDVVTIYDIYPTLISLIGEQAPSQLDGIDFSPAIKGETLPERPLFWERVFDHRYGYSVLSADARWRLYHTWPWLPWQAPLQMADLTRLPVGTQTLADISPGPVRQLERSFQAWHREVHTSNVSATTDTKTVTLRDADFLRSPGFGGFTFATSLQWPTGKNSSMILQQGQLWKLYFDIDTEHLTAQFGQHKIQAPWSKQDACTRLIVTGTFHRKLNHRKDSQNRIELQMYLDGHLVANYTAPGKLNDEGELSQPTIINRDWVTGTSVPLLLSKHLSEIPPYTIKEVDKQLCSEQQTN